MSIELQVLPTPMSEATIKYSDFQHSDMPPIEGVVSATGADLDFIAMNRTTVTNNRNLESQLSRRHVSKERIQLLALCFCMYLLGWNDGSVGSLLPRIQHAYHASYVVVSLIFVMSTIGFIIGGLINVPLNDRLGFGKTLVVGLSCLVIAYTFQIPAFPYPVFLLAFMLNGFGFSLLAAQMSGYVATLSKNSEAKMCVLHSAYGAGAFCSPFVATRFSLMPHWSFHYLTSLGITLVNLVIILYVFRFKSQDECLAEIGQPAGEQGSSADSKFSQILRIRAVYALAFFLLVYVGVEVAMGGWIVTFIVNVRHGGSSSGYVSSAFFGGLMLGRAGLLWVNQKIGGRRAIFIYAVIAIGLQLVIWFVPSVIGDAIAVSFIGILLGPMYPIAMAHSGKILPRWLVVASIGFIAGLGQSGSAILPFVTGAIAGKWGIKSLQPFLVVMMAVMVFLWYLVPSALRRPD
ncbi:hypothetical protein AX15_002703 [Amanita polypyramis BW_CC]|nr:hypothetical protein AX15_002703 [Amanita polypyramis BW_CC]